YCPLEAPLLDPPAPAPRAEGLAGGGDHHDDTMRLADGTPDHATILLRPLRGGACGPPMTARRAVGKCPNCTLSHDPRNGSVPGPPERSTDRVLPPAITGRGGLRVPGKELPAHAPL